MDIKEQAAIETREREAVEDTLEAVAERVTTWKREGRLEADVEPAMATREGDMILLFLDNGSVGIILMDTPDRSTLDGI